ncbi:MAG: hypothetical protein M3O30_16385 [Planctomycetota bacterium]|nr:hypothetical protein [Planctomycetota bacterium]
MPSTFWQDNTTDATGAALTAHAPQIGGSYTIPAGKACTALIDSANRIVNSAAAVESVAMLTGAAPLNQDVTITLNFAANPQYADLILRMGGDGSAYKGWLIGYGAGPSKRIAINNFSIDVASYPIDPASSTHTLRATVVRVASTDVITVYLDGAQILQYTDTTLLYPNAGHVGLYFYDLGIEVSNILGIDGTPVLSIGALTAAPSTTTITLSLSAPLTNGAGAGYTYSLYRATAPNFTPATGNLLVTNSTLGTTPYVDSTPAPAITYYYKLIGKDSASNIANAQPHDITVTDATTPLAAAATLTQTTFNIVWIGDSITAADSYAPNFAPGFVAAGLLATQAASRNIFFANKGVDGSGTGDWQPASANYIAASAAANTLTTANAGQLIFYIRLAGTNDSAQSGHGSGPLTPAQFKTNLQTIVNQLQTDFPSSKIFLAYAPYYTPNSATSYLYGQAGLALLPQYQLQLDAIVAAGPAGTIYAGDKRCWLYFQQNYATQMVAASGSLGTYFLHPTQSGYALLGQMDAEAITQNLFNPTPTTDSPGIQTLLTRLTQPISFNGTSGQPNVNVTSWLTATRNPLITGNVPTTPGGSGAIPLNQNTGGTDNLRYIDTHGNGIANATILIYQATDWPTNPTNVQSSSATGPDGRWATPAFVNPGTYIAVFFKLGADTPTASAPFTV